jgi:hypothetical protein
MKSGAGDDPFSDLVDEERADAEATDADADADSSTSTAAEAETTDPDTDAAVDAETEAETAAEADVDVETTPDGSVDDTPAPADVAAADDGIPWVLRRRSVKEDRPNVTQFFLRDETDRAERRFRGAVEERLDADVYLLDLREAAYVVAMRHPDEVASLLGRWGYDYLD